MKRLMMIGVFAILALSMISFAMAETNTTEESNTANDTTTSDNNNLSKVPDGTVISTKILPSPAVTFCEKRGYQAETREDSTGKKYYVCIFPDGKECNQFEFLREKCGKEYLDGVPPAPAEKVDPLKEIRDKIKSRDCADGCSLKVEGKRMTIKDLSAQRREITANKITARTGLNLSAEDVDDKTVLRAYLSNGRWALVKKMPNEASETALAKMEAKCAETGCTIELKEVSLGENKTKLAYVVETEKDAKVLWLFKKKMAVSAQVDAETGDIIAVKKPWWVFMAKEINASSSESNKTAAKNVTANNLTA